MCHKTQLYQPTNLAEFVNTYTMRATLTSNFEKNFYWMAFIHLDFCRKFRLEEITIYCINKYIYIYIYDLLKETVQKEINVVISNYLFVFLICKRKRKTEM